MDNIRAANNFLEQVGVVVQFANFRIVSFRGPPRNPARPLGELGVTEANCTTTQVGLLHRMPIGQRLGSCQAHSPLGP